MITTIDELETRIRNAIHDAKAEAVNARRGGRKPDRLSQRLRHDECSEAQHQLATAFAARHGWKLSEAPFAIAKLAPPAIRRRQRDDDFGAWWTDSGVIDGCCVDPPFYYREPHRPWRPAAIAAHLYDWSHHRDKIADLARHLEISAEPISDFPSWWYPGWTTLVLYRRRSERNPS
jgi:hypothetical protein